MRARQMLTTEMDFENILFKIRLVGLLAKVVLQPHARHALPYFQSYVVKDRHLRRKRKKWDEEMAHFEEGRINQVTEDLFK